MIVVPEARPAVPNFWLYKGIRLSSEGRPAHNLHFEPHCQEIRFLGIETRHGVPSLRAAAIPGCFLESCVCGFGDLRAGEIYCC